MRGLILIACLLFSVEVFAQHKELANLCQIFHLPDGKDTTTFIVFGNKDDLKQKKPLFLFRQGSQPMPIIHQYKDGFYMPVSPFRFRDFKDKYHFVMISKPGVRLVADSVYLDQYQKAMRNGDTSEVFVSKKYLKNNYREKYVQQCDQVIDFLVKQSWVDSKKVVFCGGSEGFTVGADLVANRNKHITHAILFSGNPERRFENIIYRLRQDAKSGIMTVKEAQEEIDKLYEVWKDICRNPESVEKSFGDTYRAWYSFSIRNLDNLLKIQIPLYVTYGTEDGEIAANMDMLPIEFEIAGKRNLTFKSYPNYNHQFFELKKNPSGEIIDKIYQGDAVAAEWIKWLER
ncbi:dienelactone hydrolase family protein [Dyadobacter sp. CY312]|uniref:dienelactone hydrolase family protein n=1 Tax=Dyadobacter sp. CY312 TaxID=2907303 RepID=UPI001F16DF22|nr:dienelactone hydrolase family protein [Dyadobacter sp. CY312]MCE7044034.1 dienelactone hydrolase family protein [Dyadobacter sp. CY312]